VIGKSSISQIFELGLVSFPIRSYVEIGVQEGFTLRWVLKNNPDLQKVLVCDDWGKSYGGSNRGNHAHILKLLEEEKFPRERVQFLDGNSQLLLEPYFRDYPDVHFHVAFVDGDHSIGGFQSDLLSMSSHAEIILVHDIRHPDHLYLKNALYKFYEQIKDNFVLMDLGENLAVLMRKRYLRERVKK